MEQKRANKSFSKLIKPIRVVKAGIRNGRRCLCHTQELVGAVVDGERGTNKENKTDGGMNK